MGYTSTVWVLLPADAGDPDTAVERMLAPFSHDAVTATWSERCACDMEATLDAADAALEQEIRDLANDLMRAPQDQRQALSLPVNERIQAAIAFHAATHPMPHDPNCADCRGTGQATREGNPDARWSDWEPDVHGAGNPLGATSNRFTTRAAMVAPALDDTLDGEVWGLLTTDGTWHDRRDHPGASWLRLVRQLLAMHPTATVVSVIIS